MPHDHDGTDWRAARKHLEANEMFYRVQLQDRTRQPSIEELLTNGGATMALKGYDAHTLANSGLFIPAQYEQGGKKVRGFKLTCGRCSISETLPGVFATGNPVADGKEERALQSKFAKAGWRVGASSEAHRCTNCVEIERSEREAAGTVLRLPMMAPKAAPLAEPGRENRRIIFIKLGDVYENEHVGYKPGWTDQRVAEDLGVPIEWVGLVRSENFGDCASNPGIDELIDKATVIETRLLAKAQECMDMGRALLEQAQGQRDEAATLTAEAAEIKASVMELNRTLKG